MIKNSELSWRIAQVINELYIENYDQDWINISQWLQLSASLNKIEIDTTKYEDTFNLPDTVLNYEEKREKVLSIFTKQIASFQFAWCALEGIADKIISKEEKIKYYGKINAVSIYLSRNYQCKELEFYRLYTDKLYNLLNCIEYYKKNILYIKKYGNNEYKYEIRNRNELIGTVNNKGIALEIVYKIRNRFAHGAMRVPIIPIEYEEQDYDKIMINIFDISHKLLLMTIQMVLITINKNVEFDGSLIDKDNENKLFDILLNLHI